MTITERQEELHVAKIAEMQPLMRNLELRFRVVSLQTPRQVFSRKIGKKLKVAEAVVGDSTGIITLILWNDDIDLIQIGETYLLKDGYVSIFEECMQLSIGRNGTITRSDTTIEEVNESNNMSRPFASRPPRKSRPRSKTGTSLSGVQGREAKGYCTWKGF
jgi:replication factor A1